MQNTQNFYFFRCYFCGEWFYSKKKIKIKKCWKCNRSFTFQKSIKFSRKCSIKGAIRIIKELKNKIESENVLKYANSEKNLTSK